MQARAAMLLASGENAVANQIRAEQPTSGNWARKLASRILCSSVPLSCMILPGESEGAALDGLCPLRVVTDAAGRGDFLAGR